MTMHNDLAIIGLDTKMSGDKTFNLESLNHLRDATKADLEPTCEFCIKYTLPATSVSLPVSPIARPTTGAMWNVEPDPA